MKDYTDERVGSKVVATYQLDSEAFGWFWFSCLLEPGEDEALDGQYGPFSTRDEARRSALFHALWFECVLPGDLTGEHMVALIERRATVTADEPEAA